MIRLARRQKIRQNLNWFRIARNHSLVNLKELLKNDHPKNKETIIPVENFESVTPISGQIFEIYFRLVHQILKINFIGRESQRIKHINVLKKSQEVTELGNLLDPIVFNLTLILKFLFEFISWAEFLFSPYSLITKKFQKG